MLSKCILLSMTSIVATTMHESLGFPPPMQSIASTHPLCDLVNLLSSTHPRNMGAVVTHMYNSTQSPVGFANSLTCVQSNESAALHCPPMIANAANSLATNHCLLMSNCAPVSTNHAGCGSMGMSNSCFPNGMVFVSKSGVTVGVSSRKALADGAKSLMDGITNAFTSSSSPPSLPTMKAMGVALTEYPESDNLENVVPLPI